MKRFLASAGVLSLLALFAPSAFAWDCGSAAGGSYIYFPTENLCGDYDVPVKVTDKKTTENKFSWKCVWPGYDEVQCSANRIYGASPTPPSCPLTVKSGDIAVNFTGWLRSDKGLNEARNIVNQNVPVGKYEVFLAAWDSYEGRQYVTQPREEFRVELWRDSSFITKSAATKDLKDKVKEAMYVSKVNDSLDVPRSATQVVAFHNKGYGFADQSPNSLRPLCAVFRPIPVCGNNKKEVGEQCDDGNKIDHDGCSAACVEEKPEIDVKKTALDGSDLQVIKPGETAKFKIVVTNTGLVDLRDISLVDSKNPACSRTAAQIKQLRGGKSVLKVGEDFPYECQQENVKESYNNEIVVKGKTIKTGEEVSNKDDSTVTVKGTPGVYIDKNDADNGDDFQLIYEGGTASYTVTVKNTSDIALKDVVVTDALPGTTCSLSLEQAKVKYAGGESANFDPGESFTYNCKQENISRNLTNTIKVEAVAVGSGKKVSDSDNTEVRVRIPGDTTPPPAPTTPEPKKEEKRDCKASIGNLVWNDKNDNGRQDAGEAGIPGVRVWLYKGNRIQKDVTDKRGRYKFKDLCKGKYTVVVKHEDIPDLYQVYDPDGKLDHKTKVRLKNDKVRYTKADFGYRGPLAPQTGPGMVISVILAALLAGGGVYYYRRKKGLS